MVFRQKGGPSAKSDFSPASQKVPKKQVFEVEEVDDDDDEDDSDMEDNDSDDASDSGGTNGRMNAKGKLQPTPGKGTPLIKTPKGQAQTPAQLSNKQKQKLAASPFQKAGKQKQSPGAKEQNRQEDVDTSLQEQAAAERRDRQARTLFLGGLPLETDSEEVKALSSDILSVSMPKTPKNKKTKIGFIEFESEKKAEENLTKLQKKKIHGKEFLVDFVGAKSINKEKVSKSELNERNVHKTKLVVLGLPTDITMGDVAQLFPKCYTITLNNNPNFRSASASFHTEEEGIEAFKANQNVKVKGRSVNIEFGSMKNRKNKRKNSGLKGSPSKKQKM